MRFITLLAILPATMGLAQAAPVNPNSYDMLNGGAGQFTYWDDSYSGTGNKTLSYSPLSGGLGDLTDGFIAAANWNSASGPYVGWQGFDPLITFNFGSTYNFDTVRINLDDSNGAGGVYAPSGVTINGTFFSLADPAGAAPFWATFDVSPLVATNTLQITLHNRFSNSWLMASEFQFSSVTPVPEPTSVLLLTSGLAGLSWIRRRHRKS